MSDGDLSNASANDSTIITPFVSGPGVYYYLEDQIGSTRVITDSAGNTCYDADFYPYGGERVVTDTCPQNYKFTGKERDAESGNDYFGARYYSSSMGRFMSPDPLPWIHLQHGDDTEQKKFAAFIASPQNFNMYAYVNNNPLNKTDPTGMNACGTNDDSPCKVTVTIADRIKDANGNYNDKFTDEKNQQNYDATATVSVNGKSVGIFLINTTPSDSSKYATIQDGTYTATLVSHDGKPALALNGGGPVPVVGGKDPASGLPYATGALIHSAGIGNYTGMYFNQKLHAMAGVSEGCQTVCTSEYGRFLQAVGVQGQVGTPQGRFTVTLDTSENQ